MSDFLKDLGQNARTEDEVEREKARKVKEAADRYAEDAISRCTENIVQGLKLSISCLAKEGKFVTVNGKRQIQGMYFYDDLHKVDGEYVNDMKVEWTSVYNRLTWEQIGIRLFSSVCTCGIMAFFFLFDEDRWEDDFVAIGQVRLTPIVQETIQRVEKILARDGIKVNGWRIQENVPEKGKPNVGTVTDLQQPFSFKRRTCRSAKIKKGQKLSVKIGLSYTVTF